MSDLVFTPAQRRRGALCAMLALAAFLPNSAIFAQAGPPLEASVPGLTYADFADLAGAADVVALATVKSTATLPPERAGNVAPGHARLYVEAQTSALLVGNGLGESVSYLADVPLDARGGPGDLRIGRDQRQFAGPARHRVREALYTPGNLAGEGETQIFLATPSAQPVSISLVRRPGQPPRWGVSLGEIVASAARPPVRDTLAWYRLACFLPRALPPRANISDPGASAQQAAADYAQVMADLGPCERDRTGGVPR